MHTFVVPAYGESAYLAPCLASLNAQTTASEIVLVTSTPFDGIEVIAARYGARLVVHDGDPGIGRDWNISLTHAKTPWVTIAHQDDVYLPRFTELTLAAAAVCPDATLIFTDYAELADGVQRAVTPMLLVKRILLEIGFIGRASVGTVSAKKRSLSFGCPIPCPSVTLRSGHVKFREDLRVNLDWDAWLRQAEAPGRFLYIRDKLMLHRVHDASETSAGVRAGVRAAEDAMMFEQLWPSVMARALARLYTLSYRPGGA